ncbi:SRPBCC family protein [Candidatus Dojkabacteria bacterium]|uniref:SRPBCC family protein n=1 Tax=Candidatus Dojkabacteria bacterium TaxID=2099670 RepID=A0A955LB35_9BACT|nr:SRPBCC family protein [Candidatus Dojkabacteria bacterium]
MKYTKEVIINKDIQTVFDQLTNPEFMVEWQESLDSYEKNSEGKWVYNDSHSGKPMKIIEDIIEKKSPNIFKVKYTTNGVINLMDNELFEIDDNTTRWASYNEFQFTNLMMKIIGFLFRNSFKNQTKKDMNAFKSAIESKING